MSDSIQYGHWQQLDHWLSQLSDFWKPVPFIEARPPWAAIHPELAEWVLALSEAQCEHLEQHPRELQAHLQGWLPAFAGCADLTDVGELDGQPRPLPERFARDMPGRKREQAGAMAGCLQPLSGRVLDWCCGKGHLARTLTAAGAASALGLEWQARLVAEGGRLAERHGDPVRLVCQDVLAEPLPWPAPEPDHLVALHACGDLHRRCLQAGARHQVPRISVSPCCYHLTGSALHTPLSARVAASPDRCRPDREQMRLAVRETVTAGRAEQGRTRLRSAWRLGFDQLQRALTGCEEYRPVPSEPSGLLQQNFEAFCRWAAAEQGLVLPGTLSALDFEGWEARGWVRHREVRRFELIRHLFRRPLELWMVLDYGLFLEEHGYSVRLGTFCERSLTPRNLLLDAHRAG